MKPRVLVACEFSGVVRDAFAAWGWDAWSCDLLPTERPGNHIQKDALEAIKKLNPLLLIAHPPCTYLANSSAKHLYKGMKKENGKNLHRWKGMRDGAAFFKALWEADVPHVAVENPIMLPYAKKIIGCGPTQIVQPWMFGHREVKATCLWLKNLPPLIPTNDVKAETMALPYAERAKVHYASPGPDRWKERSRTLTGLAEAMAEQWTWYLL